MRTRLAAQRDCAWWLFLAVMLLVRAAVSSVAISRPGLQYDETLFVNAATLRIPGFWIAKAFHGIPLMVFPYIGALKSWLYAPVFTLFGTSPATIRVPAVVIVCAGLALVYVAVGQAVNRPVAIVAFLALCFDNSVFWLTRDDVGPSALEFFFKALALFAAVRFARTRSVRWVAVLVSALALGVFNKLNFIWIVNAAAIVSVIVVIHHRSRLRSHWRAAVVWFAGLALIFACFAAYYFPNHISSVAANSTSRAVGQPWNQFERGVEAILSGTWFYDYVFGNWVSHYPYALAPLGPSGALALVVLCLFVAGALASTVWSPTRNFVVAALALVTTLTALQILLTPEATAGWHYIAIYPFLTIVAAYGAYAIGLATLRRRRRVEVFLACLCAGVLVYNGVLLGRYFHAAYDREPAYSAWSPAVYQLGRVLAHTPGQVYGADWGITNPLFALRPARRYTELVFQLLSTPAPLLPQLGKSLGSTPGPKLFVTHSKKGLVFPAATANLFRAMGSHLHLARSIPGVDGRPVFLVYAYR